MDGNGKTMIGTAGLVGGSEGERSSSMPSITGQAAGAGPLAPGQRWSLARKHEVVLRLLRGEPVEAVSRQFGVPVWQLERWRARALAGLKTGLRERSEDPAERELAEAHRRIGELSMEVELLRAGVSQSFWRLPYVEPAGGICASEPEVPDDPERVAREAEAPIEGRFQGPPLRGDTDPAGRLVVPALSPELP